MDASDTTINVSATNKTTTPLNAIALAHVRRTMTELGLNAAAVAKLANVSQPTVARVLNGHATSSHTRLAIAHALNLDPLLLDSTTNQPQPVNQNRQRRTTDQAPALLTPSERARVTHAADHAAFMVADQIAESPLYAARASALRELRLALPLALALTAPFEAYHLQGSGHGAQHAQDAMAWLAALPAIELGADFPEYAEAIVTSLAAIITWGTEHLPWTGDPAELEVAVLPVMAPFALALARLYLAYPAPDVPTPLAVRLLTTDSTP